MVQSSRDLARPVVEALKAAFSLDDYLVHIERRNAADDVAVWYPVSILSHPELVRLMEIAETTRAKIAILPDEGSKMKVELRVSGRG